VDSGSFAEGMKTFWKDAPFRWSRRLAKCPLTLAMKYRFQASENFWKRFLRLSPQQKVSVRNSWLIFKEIHSIRVLALSDQQPFRSL